VSDQVIIARQRSRRGDRGHRCAGFEPGGYGCHFVQL